MKERGVKRRKIFVHLAVVVGVAACVFAAAGCGSSATGPDTEARTPRMCSTEGCGWTGAWSQNEEMQKERAPGADTALPMWKCPKCGKFSVAYASKCRKCGKKYPDTGKGCPHCATAVK
jgi:predicted RNA-binding Zn-ribbon protein involved in translation (DUF1610 family)